MYNHLFITSDKTTEINEDDDDMPEDNNVDSINVELSNKKQDESELKPKQDDKRKPVAGDSKETETNKKKQEDIKDEDEGNKDVSTDAKENEKGGKVEDEDEDEDEEVDIDTDKDSDKDTSNESGMFHASYVLAFNLGHLDFLAHQANKSYFRTDFSNAPKSGK